MTDARETEPEEGLLDLAAAIWQRRLYVLLVTGVCLIAGIIYLHAATYRYTAEMRVIPSQAPANSATSRADKFGGLASLVGISTESSETSPFKLYLEEMASRDTASALVMDPSIARVIFAREWDNATKRWVEPTSERNGAMTALKSLMGFPASDWRPPDGARMQEFLRTRVKIDSAPTQTVTVIRFDHVDPQFAVKVLAALNSIVDQHLRAVALARSSEYAKFLETKLATITIAEHRVAITEVLSEQEKLIMLASSSAPYAADLVEAPTASLRPTSPRPIIVLAASIVLGLVLGVLGTMIAIYLREWRIGRSSEALIDSAA